MTKEKQNNIPECFYRVSIKALVVNTDGKFLLQKEDGYGWDLPGGGLDFGENPTEALKREIDEELKLEVLSMETRPSYFVTTYSERFNVWYANVLYKTELSDITKFTPSDEASEMKYFTAQEVLDMSDGEAQSHVVNFAKQYKIKTN